MDFVIEVIRAVVLVGVPICLFTVALVWWGMRGGYFPETDDGQSIKSQIKAMGKKKRSKDSHPQSLLQKKWAKFGGGFYGITAFFTYLVIEAKELIDMIMNFGGFISFLKQLDLGVIIGFLVESLTNFIAAMVWPVYWMKRIDSDQTWLWFVVAYAAYWLGIRLAQQLNSMRR